MRSGIYHKSLWLFLAAAVCAVGMWTYAERRAPMAEGPG